MLCLNVTHGCTPGKRQALGTVWECKSVIIAWHAFLKACCVLRGMKQLLRHTVCVCVPVLAGFQAFILKKNWWPLSLGMEDFSIDGTNLCMC